MARTRQIKPELATHEGLFEAEQRTGLPLRLAYVNLWCHCDREGRFEWRPKRLKLFVLPWDDLDFAAVLDALTRFGFLIKYTAEGKTWGAIPSWKKHQKPHPNEAESAIPPPPDEETSTNGRRPSTIGASPSTNGKAPQSCSYSSSNSSPNSSSSSEAVAAKGCCVVSEEARKQTFDELRKRRLSPMMAQDFAERIHPEDLREILTCYDAKRAAGKIKKHRGGLIDMLRFPEKWDFERSEEGRLKAPQDGEMVLTLQDGEMVLTLKERSRLLRERANSGSS